MTLVCNILLSTPVKCLSTFLFFVSVSACMAGCTGFKWLGKYSDTKCPTPFPNYSPIWKCVYSFLHRLHALQPTTPRLPKSVADVDLFCVDVFVFYLFHFLNCFTLKYISCFCQSFWTNSFDCRRVQVRFVASGSMSRMSPSRQWSWTSPLARGLSGPRTSWTVSYRRSTPSPSRPTTVEKVLMEPTWKNRTSEWNYLFRRSLRLFPSESGLYTDCISYLTENEKEKKDLIKMNIYLFLF